MSPQNKPAEQFKPFRQAANDYIAHLRVERGLSKSTTYCYSSWLHNFENWLEGNGYPSPTLEAFNKIVLTRFLHAQHAKNLRPRSIRSVFYPLRGLGDYLVQQEILEENPAKKITLPKKDAAIREQVTDAEVEVLIDAAGRIRNKQRAALARAVLSIFVHAGLRRAEALGLHVGDINTEEQSVLVRSGKGSKSRRVFVHTTCIAAVQEWLSLRPSSGTHDMLFIGGGSRRPLGDTALISLLDEIKSIAGYRAVRRICLHALRHNCATRLLRNGADLGQIQVFLGHTSIVTTQAYLHTGEENIRGIAHLTGLRPSGETTPPEKPALQRTRQVQRPVSRYRQTR